MKDDHEAGWCHMCGKEAMVRYKNIYHIGSEGLWCCMSCEMKIVNFVRECTRESMDLKKKEIMKKKENEKWDKQLKRI